MNGRPSCDPIEHPIETRSTVWLRESREPSGPLRPEGFPCLMLPAAKTQADQVRGRAVQSLEDATTRFLEAR